jgi:Nucleotidyl transferase AbiEii toxin, Type IV TA system
MADVEQLETDQRRALDRVAPIVHRSRLYLAGGAALTFHLHHRQSRDVDLFSLEPELDLEQVRRSLVALPEVEVDSMTDVTLRVRVTGVPVDVVQYPYPLLKPALEGPAGIPVAQLEDLATMKLSAAARRGIRRDFWDLYVMFQRATPTLEQALDDYKLRFGVSESDVYHVLKALTYFDDAEAEASYPLGLTKEEWRQIKRAITADAQRALRSRLAPAT